jgi:hypothetical protein
MGFSRGSGLGEGFPAAIDLELGLDCCSFRIRRSIAV